MNRQLRRATMAVMTTALLAGTTARAAGPALFDPAAKEWEKAVESGQGTSVSAEGQGWLRVRASSPATDRRILIRPASGAWDLSASAGLSLALRNPNDVPMTVRLLAANADAKGLSNTCRFAVELQANETRDVFMRLTRRPADPTYDVFKPWLMYYKNMNVRDNTIDPAAVVSISLTVSGKGEGGVDVSAITPSGDGKPVGGAFFPFVDRYGQYIHGDWPGKIYADSDFAQRLVEEKRERAGWPKPEEWDKWGGWKNGPTLKATGFFYPAKHDGKWWLVNPDGKLFWSYGPTGVGFGGDSTPITDRENWFADLPKQDDPTFGRYYKKGRGAMYMHYVDRDWLGYDVQESNLLRKYGPDYKKAAAEVLHDRLHSWGFNTIANWSAPEVYNLHKTPYTVAVHYGSPIIHRSKDMPDVYDPAWEPAVRAAMERHRGKTAGDPWNIGYFIDNERWFGWRPRGAAIGEHTLENPPERRAKIKFVEDLKAKYKTIEALNTAWETEHESWDALLAFRRAPNMKNTTVLEDCGDFGMAFAERYFTVCRQAVKDVAPDNMYLGSRFFGHTDPALVELAAKYVDVISYNIYDNPPDGRVNQYAKIDKPIMSTEWGIESDPMQTPFRDAKLTAPTPAERAKKMTDYVERALRLPNLVGAHFFQLRDQPISGRSDGEATLRGFLNVADTPNFELIQANRRVAYNLYETRSKAK